MNDQQLDIRILLAQELVELEGFHVNLEHRHGSLPRCTR